MLHEQRSGWFTPVLSIAKLTWWCCQNQMILLLMKVYVALTSLRRRGHIHHTCMYFDGPGDPYIKLSSLPQEMALESSESFCRSTPEYADRIYRSVLVFSKKRKIKFKFGKRNIVSLHNGCWGAFIIQGLSLYLLDYKRFLRQLLILIWKMHVLVKRFRRFCFMNLVYMIT